MKYITYFITAATWGVKNFAGNEFTIDPLQLKYLTTSKEAIKPTNPPNTLSVELKSSNVPNDDPPHAIIFN